MWWKFIVDFVVKRPYIPIIIGLLVMLGVSHLKVGGLESDVATLEAELTQKTAIVETVQANYNTCVDATQVLNDSIEQQKVIIKGLRGQVDKEREISVYWKNMYESRPTKIKEVPVVKYVEKGVVVDEESSTKYIDFINTMYTD